LPSRGLSGGNPEKRKTDHALKRDPGTTLLDFLNFSSILVGKIA